MSEICTIQYYTLNIKSRTSHSWLSTKTTEQSCASHEKLFSLSADVHNIATVQQAKKPYSQQNTTFGVTLAAVEWGHQMQFTGHLLRSHDQESNIMHVLMTHAGMR